MPDALTVHVNRGEIHSLDVPPTFETSDSFDVRLVNHGEATHVHLHLDDSLSELAAIDAPNHHVSRDSDRLVRVTLTRDGSVRGNLKVATAYGATTRYIELIVTEPESTDEPVEVGEELTKPQPRTESQSQSRAREIPDIALVGAVVVALALLAGTVAVFQNIVLVLAIGVLAVSVAAAVVLVRLN